jgi:hypothetical protein
VRGGRDTGTHYNMDCGARGGRAGFGGGSGSDGGSRQSELKKTEG